MTLVAPYATDPSSDAKHKFYATDGGYVEYDFSAVTGRWSKFVLVEKGTYQGKPNAATSIFVWKKEVSGTVTDAGTFSWANVSSGAVGPNIRDDTVKKNAPRIRPINTKPPFAFAYACAEQPDVYLQRQLQIALTFPKADFSMSHEGELQAGGFCF